MPLQLGSLVYFLFALLPLPAGKTWSRLKSNPPRLVNKPYSMPVSLSRWVALWRMFWGLRKQFLAETFILKGTKIHKQSNDQGGVPQEYRCYVSSHLLIFPFPWWIDFTAGLEHPSQLAVVLGNFPFRCISGCIFSFHLLLLSFITHIALKHSSGQSSM